MEFWNYRLPNGAIVMQLAPKGRNRTLVLDWDTLRRSYMQNDVLTSLPADRVWIAPYAEVMSEIRYRERTSRQRRRVLSLQALRRTLEELKAREPNGETISN